MYKSKIALLCLAFLVGFAAYLNAEDSKKVTCSGKVVDSQGQGIAGAKVGLYKVIVSMQALSYEVELAQQVTTKDDGSFVFEPADRGDVTNQFVVMAEKEGLAVGWANWHKPEEDLEAEITLTDAKILAGKVVDESGNAVSDADVMISFMMIPSGNQPRYMIGKVSGEFFGTKTNANGEFTFNRIPAEATAEFTVQKVGLATVSTFVSAGFSGTLQYSAGQKDIKIEIAPESKIEGVVVEKGTDKPVVNIRLIAVQDRNQPNFGQEPVVSKADGTFTIDGLGAGTYKLQILPPREGTAEWIAATVEVTTELGKTQSGIKIEVGKGGVLEVTVTDAEKKPVENASVSISQEETNQRFHCRSDKEGLARIRLPAGDYQIQSVYKQGYVHSQKQNAVTIQDNETVRLEMSLAESPKITGTVRDKSGGTVAGAEIRIVPRGGGVGKSDDDGKYEIKWDPRSWGGQEDMVCYLVVRESERNLAAALEFDEDTTKNDITLADGVIFTGKVVDTEGQAIEGARVMVMFRSSSWGSSILDHQKRPTTDAEGKFKIRAMPPECKYDVYVSGEGYGKQRVEALSDDAVDGKLDLGKFTLALANLSVSGIVVDSEDKPVSGADIYANGEGQPDCHGIKTDAEGKFTIEKVCSGRIRINVHTQGERRLYGYIETEGGASDVKIVVAASGSSSRFVPKQPPSLVGKPLPGFEGLGLQIDPGVIADKVILVCFWDMQQRPSRHCIKGLARQAAQLKEKGVVVIAVQASKVDKNTLDEWVKKYNIPFTVGMIEGDEDKTRFAWGAKALPWLILTNAEHIVQAEGFGLNEIDEKMNSN